MLFDAPEHPCESFLNICYRRRAFDTQPEAKGLQVDLCLPEDPVQVQITAHFRGERGQKLPLRIEMEDEPAAFFAQAVGDPRNKNGFAAAADPRDKIQIIGRMFLAEFADDPFGLGSAFHHLKLRLAKDKCVRSRHVPVSPPMESRSEGIT